MCFCMVVDHWNCYEIAMVSMLTTTQCLVVTTYIMIIMNFIIVLIDSCVFFSWYYTSSIQHSHLNVTSETMFSFLVWNMWPPNMQDQSGYISLDELLNGYDKLPEFQEQMRLMDVEREDMQLGGELGGGFKFFFNFHPYLGTWSNLTIIFSDRLKPQTSFACFSWWFVQRILPW